METNSLEADLRQALSRRAAEVPEEAIERLRNQRYRPRATARARIAGAGLSGAAAAAAAAVLAITVAHSGSTPASRPGSARESIPARAQLADWTVTRQADGTVDITIRHLGDLAGLQSKLRAVGVPATIVTLATLTPGCVTYPLTATQSQQVFQFPNSQTLYIGPSHLRFIRGATTVAINEPAMPKGMGVQILARADKLSLLRAVRASQECTGS
jgi:hypothetical protein